MTPQEKELITTLLDRLRSAAGQPKDAEADALIRQQLADQPDAPYSLVQTVLIQDLSLHNAQNRIAALEAQLTQMQQQPARPTSFLGNLFGHGQQAPPPPAPASVPQAGPWGRPSQAPPPGYGQPGYGPAGYAQPGAAPTSALAGGSGGFLRSAATTAAGVAGGALLFDGIRSLFGGGAGGLLGGQSMAPGLGESVINNYYGGNPGQGDWGGNQDFSGGSDPGNQDFSGGSDPGGQDFSGGSDPGGQDFGTDQDFSGGDNSTC